MKAASLRGAEPACRGCDWNPELMPENNDAWELWLNIHTQWRAGPAGAIGLDYPAVYQEASLMGIDLSPGLRAKIRALERYELNRQTSEVRHDSGGGKGSGPAAGGAQKGA